MPRRCRKSIGQRVTVDNKTGAGGGVAAAAVQNAAPDGYTLLVFSGSQHATVPAVGNAPYDPVKGFSPIAYLFNSVVCSLCRRTARPSRWRSCTSGPQEAGRADGRHAGTGVAVASARLQDTARGQGAVGDRALSRRRADDGRSDHRPRRNRLADAVDVAVLSRRGKLRALALDADARWAPLPDVPTLVELGFDQGARGELVRVGGPAGMPPALVARSGTSSSRHRRTPSCSGA